MSVPNELMQAMTEANNRGLLEGEQKEVFDAMIDRGMVDAPQQVPLFEAARESGFLKGYMDQAAGISQLAARLAPDSRPPEVILDKELSKKIPSSAQRIDDFISREEIEYQKTREGGIDWARMAGGIVNPVSVATMRLGTAATVPKRIMAGAGYGAATGASMPVTDEDADYGFTKLAQTGIGGTVGAIVPGVAETVKGAWNLKRYLTRPFTESGRLKDLQELYVRLAGESKDVLVEALDNAKTHIYRNKPTAGQAIADYNLTEGVNVGSAIARLEKDLTRKGTTGDPLKTLADKQVLRRADAIKRMIDSSDEGLASAENLRRTVTKPLYDAVKTSTKQVNTRPVLTEVKDLLAENKNQDSIALPLRKIQKKLYTMTDDGPQLDRNPGSLYSLSKQIRDMMNRKTPGGQNEYDVMALSKVKKLLDGQIGKAEKNYSKAQELFKEYSEPVNQINTIRFLGSALKSSVEEEKAIPFLNAIEKAPKTLKTSTGFARYDKLDDVLNEKQMQVINKVKKELIRQSKTSKMASGTEGMYGQLKEGIEPELPNMLSRPALIANAILRRIGKDMGPKYEKMAVQLQEHPERLAELMRRGTDDKERKIAYELLATLSATVPIRTLAMEAQISSQDNEE